MTSPYEALHSQLMLCISVKGSAKSRSIGTSMHLVLHKQSLHRIDTTLIKFIVLALPNLDVRYYQIAIAIVYSKKNHVLNFGYLVKTEISIISPLPYFLFCWSCIACTKKTTENYSCSGRLITTKGTGSIEPFTFINICKLHMTFLRFCMNCLLKQGSRYVQIFHSTTML